jgi:hypothetical protein
MTKRSLRRTSITAAIVLAGCNAAAVPALASVSDGTSNTIQVAHLLGVHASLIESDGLYPPFA